MACFVENMPLLCNCELGSFPSNNCCQLWEVHCDSGAHWQELHVGNNAVRAVTGDTLTCLISLSVLDLRDNRLDTLPDEVGLCQTLERLDLTNNSLSMLVTYYCPFFFVLCTHNRFMAFFLWLLRWAGARRNLLDCCGAREDNTGRHIDHPAGRHSLRTYQRPISSSFPHFYTGCPSCCNPPTLSWLGTGTKYAGLRTLWSGLSIADYFSALTLLAWWQKRYPTHKMPVPLIPKGSFLEQVEKESQEGTGWPRFTWKTSIKTEMVVVFLV